MNDKEILATRLEELKKEPKEVLLERVRLMRAAVELKNNDYFIQLEQDLRSALDQYRTLKDGYSFTAKYLNKEVGEFEEMKMLTAEVKAETRREILETIQFHIEDGKLAELALRQNG